MKATPRQLLAAPFLIFALGLARAMVLSVPFRMYAGIFGSDAPHEEHSTIISADFDANSRARARRLGALIETLARHTPWRSNCLAQAIVAAVCLRMMGIAYHVHFGVASSSCAEGALDAHSWVMAGDVPVTGFREAQAMIQVRAFHWLA